MLLLSMLALMAGLVTRPLLQVYNGQRPTLIVAIRVSLSYQPVVVMVLYFNGQ